MKTCIIYESATGFTAQYAAWLAEALGCDCKPRKQCVQAELADCERVIYGGWIMGNGIMGLEQLLGKTLVAVTNLPPRKIMGQDSCGMLLSAERADTLHLVMLDDAVPAGARLV